MTPRPMRRDEEPAVRDLLRRCLPNAPAKAPGFFGVVQTLVIRDDDGLDAAVTFCVAPSLDPVLAARAVWWCFGLDMAVDPSHRGKGLGHVLHAEVLRLARAADVTHFATITWPSNAPQIRVLEASGFQRAPQSVPGAFPWQAEADRDGVLFLGPIKEE